MNQLQQTRRKSRKKIEKKGEIEDEFNRTKKKEYSSRNEDQGVEKRI